MRGEKISSSLPAASARLTTRDIVLELMVSPGSGLSALDQAGEAGGAAVDAIRRGPRIVDQEALLRRRSGIVARERGQVEALVARRRGELEVTKRRAELRRDVHARLRRPEHDVPGEVLRRRLARCVAPLPVDLARTPQVTRELAAVDELGNGSLQERRRRAARDVLAARDQVRQTRRQHQVGKAKRRIQHLVERPGVDDPAVRIESLDRREWTPDVAELAVVIILQ